MGRIFKKGESGAATSYINRTQAVKRLQIPLKDFRRLCILKGIYPVEPSHKKKVSKKNPTNKTYYYLKDIKFLSNEPLINEFRSFKVFLKRLTKAIGKHDQERANHLRENEPVFKLDHIVKERYPTFIDALRDLDDALSMCFLFSTLPKSRTVNEEIIHLCRRLTVEFMYYVMESQSLRKVFISIKGIYYQAEIMGQVITWIVPHILGYNEPTAVDFKVMVTFVKFYSTVLGFVNFKLFGSINFAYPPKLSVEHPTGEELLKGEEETTEFVAALNLSLKSALNSATEEEVQPDEFPSSDDDLEAQKLRLEKLQKLKSLFKGCKIFLNREVPRESLIFVIRSFGGEVSFDKNVSVGATFPEEDLSITHQIVDRPSARNPYLGRCYIQPQWVYDSVNAGMLLPVDLFFPGEKLPPHLSPFVPEEGYQPPEKTALVQYQKGVKTALHRMKESGPDIESKDETNNDRNIKKSKKRKIQETADKNVKMQVSEGIPLKTHPDKIAENEAAEEKKLRIMMMRKKDKHLYKKIVYGQKRKNREVEKMKQKREDYEKQQKVKKKKVAD